MNIRILNRGIPMEKSITMGKGRTVNGSRTMEKSAIIYKRWAIHRGRGMRKSRTMWSRTMWSRRWSKSKIINVITVIWIITMNGNIAKCIEVEE